MHELACKSLEIKINDPRILAVPEIDNGEELVTLNDISRLYKASQMRTSILGIRDSENPIARVSIRDMLTKAISLLPSSLGMVLIESYRPYAFQKDLFDNQVAKLRIEYPQLNLEQLAIKASQFVSNPDVFSPHVTGAAIDVSLVNLDNMDWLPMGNDFEYTDSAMTLYKGLTVDQVENRQRLINVMTEAGFSNYTYEWWHWSYGDKWWAFMTGKSNAIFAAIKNK